MPPKGVPKKVFHKPVGPVGGIKRTPRNIGDPASVNKHQTYTVVGLESVCRLAKQDGTVTDHFFVLWGGDWVESKYKTWEPAEHLPGLEALIKPHLDKRDADETRLEQEGLARLAAAKARKENRAKKGRCNMFLP
jgi:hypothetical protein